MSRRALVYAACLLLFALGAALWAYDGWLERETQRRIETAVTQGIAQRNRIEASLRRIESILTPSNKEER